MQKIGTRKIEAKKTGTRKIENRKMDYRLDDKTVDLIAKEINQFLTLLKMEEKDVLRLRLSVEEMLLNWQDRFGKEQEITLKIGTRIRKPFIILELRGDECDPIHSGQENSWMSRMLADMELEPAYQYQKETNIVTIYPKQKKKGMIFWLIVAVLLGALVGAFSGFLPDSFKTGTVEQVITPVMNTFFGLIGMLAGPLIFLSVFTGICGIGDVSTFSKIGGKVVSRSLLYSLLGTVVTAVSSFFWFQMNLESGELSGSAMGELFQMILDILPTNLVDAFLSGNTMQIIVLAVAFGAAALILGERMQSIIRVCEQLQKLISIIMGWLCNVIPVLIFLTILQNIWSGTAKVILSGWRPILLIFVLLLLLMVVQIGWVCFRLKIKPGIYIKKILPAAMIGFSTGSSSAAFTKTNEMVTEKMGVEKTFAGFAIPLYMVLMGVVNSVVFYSFMMYSAINYNVSISIGWMLLSVLTVTLLSSATPPVAGAGLTIYTVLFTQMGIPSEAIPIVLTLDIVCEFMATGVKVAMMENETVLNACQNQLCDRKVLGE